MEKPAQAKIEREPASRPEAKRAPEQATAGHDVPVALEQAVGGLDGADTARPVLAPAALLALQRAAGNRAVVARLDATAQRVAVTNQATSETLYNQSSGGQATAAQYSINANYEMTRAGDSGATVQVKIKFLSQARNTVPPPPGGSGPAVGALIGSPAEIPASDTARRDWATNMTTSALTHWNGRLTLVGEEVNVLSANTPKRLPVTFQAVPVWGLNEEAHNTVIVHPPAVQGGSTGNPIDAGNYYMNKDASVYPANDDIIYAHEYGHLIGIPDEYSQSNAQMNALLHQASPSGAASSMAALDRKTVERMVLSAMGRPLYAQLQTTMPAVTGAIRAEMAQVKTKIAQAAKAGVRDPAVRAELTSELNALSEAAVQPGIPSAVAFETTANFSNVTVAGQGVETAFSAGAVGTQIGDAYWRVLRAPLADVVNVAGLGDVKINLQSAITSAAGAGTPQAASASGLATTVVGASPAPAAGAPPGLPALPPPSTLAGQIGALPGTWSAAGSALQTGVTPAAFTAKMVAALQSAAAAAAAPAPPGVAPPPKIARAPEMWRKALQLMTGGAKEAARQLAVDLIATSVEPVLTASVTALQTGIQTEVTRIMTTPPATLAAAGPPDPNMTAMVNAMKARLDAAKAATAGSGRDPLGSGQAAPAQDVTYSYQGLMGSNRSAALRADQFQPLVAQFNSKLKTFWEKAFRADVH
ncbi:MAG TPA: hypothetical protein VFJ85_05330 [Acidimicrobiales bacterium]|nr:hypothetical protein [Acidimicrobiales bacterium]